MKFLNVLIAAICICIGAFFCIRATTTGNQAKELSNEATNLAKQQEELNKKADEMIKENSDKLELKKEYEDRIHYIETPVAFLSFDDAPTSHTKEIVDILDRNNVKGTFYVVGNYVNEGTKETLQYIVDHGHKIANHSQTHDYKKLYSSVDGFFNDIYACEKALKDTIGIETKLLRFPSGTASAKNFCKKYSGSDETFPAIMARLEKEGYTVCDWNIDTNDWRSSNTIDDIISDVKIYGGAVKRDKGYKCALVLMHNKEKSVQVLPHVIKTLKDLGYEFEAQKENDYTTYVQRKK